MDSRRPPPSHAHPRHHNYVRSEHPFRRHPYQQQLLRPQFPPTNRDRLPGPPPNRPNFIVELRPDSPRAAKKPNAEAAIQKLEFQPQEWNFFPSNAVSAALFYEQWSHALSTVVQFWEMKLNDGGFSFLPHVISNVEVPSDRLELNSRLKVLFLEKLKGLKEGELMRKWTNEFETVMGEIKRICRLLSKNRSSVREFTEMWEKREGLEGEKKYISNRIEEFSCGITCIEKYLEGEGNNKETDVEIFRFSGGKIEWQRIYMLMMRECRRLDDGLPIYAHRREIMKRIHSEQVTVLIGETCSGKSTQLVQFLADSGICGQASIICTQPRKLAAISLKNRVKEESLGCYDDNSVLFHPSYSSHQEFESNVIFMTDHCLLQHYMSDKKLSRISCIVVDEAHERSLNTDLLLALIKTLLCQRPCLRLIIMSATADAHQFADYFFGCRTLHMSGRNFPVAIKYQPCQSEVALPSRLMPSYVHDVVNTASKINKNERGGTILAFLTSQSEVEWACENFQASAAVALPLHGKLSYEDQHRVFLAYPGKRKVIFATNVAETSLTIPGVKYVVDSGMVKESIYDPATGMNTLKVCRISQSSAKQRAGRAGRTESGTCYRLYSENDFESMRPHQEPEIRKVHLGVAILKIIALGMKDVQEFDFFDAPDARAIDMAVRNLIQIGAIIVKDEAFEVTTEGRQIVKLGIEPRLGKIIIQSFRQRLGKEGLVLAAVMANSSTIFCRVGTEEAKLKSDCLKVQFCHPAGDLFTFLSVYKEWEAVPFEKKNAWCWNNSINSKSLRRCHDTVLELEACLKNELNIIVPNYWCWDPLLHGEDEKRLKNIIASSMPENVAMYSGTDQLGYEVALTRKYAQLHQSCSLLTFGVRPSWVVFSEIISLSNEYLTCATACDFDSFSTISPPPPFDLLEMNSQQLHKRVLSGFGSVQLKRFCGKSNSNVHFLESRIKESCADARICVVVDVDKHEVLLYASSQDMEKVMGFVTEALEYEKQFLQKECLEKFLFIAGRKVLPSIALFGAGAEIKHLELENGYMSVDVYHSKVTALDQKELLSFLERSTSGSICSISRFLDSSEDKDKEHKWGRVTFFTPDAAKKAAELKEVSFGGDLLKVVPYRNIYNGDPRTTSFDRIKASISWPRRRNNGRAFLKCNPDDVDLILEDLHDPIIGDKGISCVRSDTYNDSILVYGFDKELSQDDIYPLLRASTERQIKDFFLVLGRKTFDHLSPLACEDAILREISPFMPEGNEGAGAGAGAPVNVKVFPPGPKDPFMRAQIDFDGSLHLEAAKALEHIDGEELPGFKSWQKIVCHRIFDGSVYCPSSVYPFIKNQLHDLLNRLPQYRAGAECVLERTYTGGYRIKVSANATKCVFEMKKDLEELIRGTIIDHPDITPEVLQILFSRDGVMLMKSMERRTQTQILFDKQKMTLRIYGPQVMIENAKESFVKALLALYESRHLEIRLRDGVLPPDMLKRVVHRFGPDLSGLKEKVPGVELSLNTRRHTISIIGNKELKEEVEKTIHDLAQTTSEIQSERNDLENACPICLCHVEDPYMLEDCHHEACRSCLIEQCESSIRNHDCLPLLCAKEGCGSRILIVDIKSLLPKDKLDELFRASLGAYVAASGGTYKFCPSPDCSSVYRVAGPGEAGAGFRCGACLTSTCTKCHADYHPLITCEKFQEFKVDPDSSLKEWCTGKEHVKVCPGCGVTIEKWLGCDHMTCRCGKHVCWVCLDSFDNADECMSHLSDEHGGFDGDDVDAHVALDFLNGDSDDDAW